MDKFGHILNNRTHSFFTTHLYKFSKFTQACLDQAYPSLPKPGKYQLHVNLQNF